MLRILFLLLITIWIPSGCATPPPDVNPAADQEESCDNIKKLVTSYANGFRDIRGALRPTKRMDIWSTKHHLVGSACEIWGWSTGKINYTCSKTFPTEDIASDRYMEVKGNLQRCLAGWSVTERARKLGTGKKVVFQRESLLPAVTLHIVNTQGVFKSEWTAYIFIGDVSDDL